jgi:hypothetical protein
MMLCNLNYLGGTDQVDHGSKPMQANSSRDHISKLHKPLRADGMAQVIECLTSMRPTVQTPELPKKKMKGRNCNNGKKYINCF